MSENIQDHPLFVFLRSTLAQQCTPLEVVSLLDMDELLEFAAKQAIKGIVYEGLKLNRQAYPEVIQRKEVLKWAGLTEKGRRLFAIAQRRVEDLSRIFAEAGFSSCILKGQGLSLIYPVHESRTPGDIDIWVKGSREDITAFVRSKCPDVFEQYHHIDFPIFKDMVVEVHYLPAQMASPINNSRLQAYYRQQQEEQFTNRCQVLGEHVCIPTKTFNAIFLLSHMMRHFFNEGVGLRQLVDYYYLLKQGFTATEKTEFATTVKHLGMEKFAGAVMWIEMNVLGIDRDHLLIPPLEKTGRLLFEEILGTGNFGYLDKRYTFREKGILACALTDVYRDFLLAKMFPSEALWKPYAKLVNQQWKIKDYFRNRVRTDR